MELKPRMTFNEMADYYAHKTNKIPAKVAVGLFARILGYKIYRPMVKGKRRFFYLKN